MGSREAVKAPSPGARPPKAEEVFEDMLLQLCAGRGDGELLHAQLASRAPREEVSTPFSHPDIHSSFELALVTEGAARVAVPSVAASSEVFELRPGRLLLIDPGVEHDESPAEQPIPYVGFWCAIQDTKARLYRTSYSPPKTWRSGPNLELSGRTGLEGMARAMATEMGNREWNWLACVNALVVYVGSILLRRLRRGSVLRLRATESPAISVEPRTWRVIQEALAFCDSNFRRPIRLTDVAAAVGYSPTHLSRVISTHLGHSLSDHIRDLRITAGKHLLETSDLSIGEVSHSLGYSDPAHFSHAFTRATGMSPRAYRRRMGIP
jgi:AraC-like DNA-binding protein